MSSQTKLFKNTIFYLVKIFLLCNIKTVNIQKPISRSQKETVSHFFHEHTGFNDCFYLNDFTRTTYTIYKPTRSFKLGENTERHKINDRCFLLDCNQSTRQNIVADQANETIIKM